MVLSLDQRKGLVVGPRLLGIIAVLAVTAAACGDDDRDGVATPAGGGDRVAVVASFYPLAEVAERVGGDAADVQNLTPAGMGLTTSS